MSPNGGSAKIIQFVRLKEVLGITSQTVVEEIEKHSIKVNKTAAEIRLFINDSKILVRKKITKLEAKPYQDLVEEDDLHVITGAKLTHSNYLITLDKKHLLKEAVKRLVKPLKIVSPKDYLQKLI